MTLEGKIIHGVELEAGAESDSTLELTLHGGLRVTLASCDCDEVVIAFGPIGSYVDLSGYYTKKEIDGKGYLTEHQDISGKADKATTYTKKEVNSALGNKQDKLESGTNIKSINGTSVLGSGNITIPGGADGKSAYQSYVDTTTDVPVKTEAEWVLSLKGEDGEPGAQGPQGPAGADGQDGADGVSLGEVALVQTTGDATDEVMSQKAVTEYGRKVTAEDLNGTSEWIKAKLTEEGWEFGKYVTSGGGLTNGADWIATPFIPVSGIEYHTITVYWGVVASANWLSWCAYDENKTRLAYISYSSDDIYKTSKLNSYSSTIAYIRVSAHKSMFKDFYVYDETEKKLIIDSGSSILNLCENRVIDCNVLKNNIIKDKLLDNNGATASLSLVNSIKKNVDAIGRRSFGITSVFNANYQGSATQCHSVKKYNTSSLPWVDVVTYNVSLGSSGQGLFFGFCPYAVDNPIQSNDYIGFQNNVWAVNFIVRRGGTTLYTLTNAIPSIISNTVVGFRLDFRRKTLIWMSRKWNDGTLSTGTIDLSPYDIDLGMCYLYTTFGYCSHVANQYIGWNSTINMNDFSAFFNNALIVGKFKNYEEHPYPSDDIDGGVFREFTNPMSNLSSSQDENGHWVASIDLSTFTDVRVEVELIPSTHYLYSNWNMLWYIGKIKATNGNAQLKQRNYATIKDVYDLTDDTFITGTDDIYTITENHIVEVRINISINSRSTPFQIMGTCNLEMWGWEVHVAINENLTPTNYDGSIVFGGIPFEFNRPNLVIDEPLMGNGTNLHAQGFMKYASNKIYARVYDTSTNTYVDKQISNT